MRGSLKGKEEGYRRFLFEIWDGKLAKCCSRKKVNRLRGLSRQIELNRVEGYEVRLNGAISKAEENIKHLLKYKT